MESPSVERRLSAVVALDVAGYSRLMGLDERATLRALKAHRAELLEPAVAARHGRVVKSTGDGFLLEFASIVDAVSFAVDVQRGMLSRNLGVPEDRRIVFRMGVNIGDIIVDGGDIFGDGVNVAARLEALCEPGGICISRAANEQIRGKLTLPFADLGEQMVKNIAHPVGVHGLSAREIALLPAPPGNSHRTKPGGAHGRRRAAVATGIVVLAALAGAGWWFGDRAGWFESDDFERRLTEAVARSLPGATEKTRAEIVTGYIKFDRSRALAIAPRAGRVWRTAGWPNDEQARERALERCQQHYDEPCVLVAVEDKIVPPGPNNATTLWDMPRVRYQGPFDVTKIPGLRDKELQRADVTGYRSAAGPKAAAFHADGILRIVTGAANQRVAEEQALQACNADPARRSSQIACVLYAVGDRVVLTTRATAPITAAAPPAAQPAPPAAPADSTIRTALSAAVATLAPSLAEQARTAQVTSYVQERQHRAMAVFPPSGTWRTTSWSSPAQAEERVLEGCQLRYGGPCVLVAVNDGVRSAPADGNWPRREMPRLAYDGLFDVAQVPIVNEGVRSRLDVAGYNVQPAPKAAAINPAGRFVVMVAAANQRDAEQKALAACNEEPQKGGVDGPCFLYAAGDQVVLRRRSSVPISSVAEPKPPTPDPPAVTADNPLIAALNAAIAKVAPSIPEATRTTIASSYVQDRQHKAIAVFPPVATWRTAGWANATIAEERVLEGCQLRHGSPCILLAINDSIGSPAADGSWPRRDMPRIAYDGLFDPRQLPIVNETTRQRAEVAAYRQQQGPKAAALHPIGRLYVAGGGANQREAEQKALADCNGEMRRDGRDGPCFLYAAGDQVVLRQRRTTPLTAAP